MVTHAEGVSERDPGTRILLRERLRAVSRRIRRSASLLLAIFFVGLGVALVWFTKAVVGVRGDALFVAELVLPALIFLVLAGRISELTAGGVTAKFREAAASTPDVGAATIDAGADLLAKDTLDRLESRLRQISERNEPIALTLHLRSRRLRQRFRYDSFVLSQYLSGLAPFKRFWFIVFVDYDGQFLGCLPAEQILADLHPTGGRVHERSDLVERVVRAVNTGDVDEVRELPGLIVQTLDSSTTNAEALREMERLGLEAMVITDLRRRVRGIVERDRIVAKMMLALTAQPAS